jgi:hypothetical protein
MRKWIAARYARYTPDGKFWLTIAVACLIVDMAIGYLAGVAVGTFWHGVGYAALAAGFAFLPDAAYEEYEKNRMASAMVVAALCVPIGLKAYEQQLTYSTGVRQGEMQVVSVQNAKYTGAQYDVSRVKSELAVLMTVQENMAKEIPWAATVKADALRETIKTLDKAIREEGGKHNGGCKSKCLALMAKKEATEKQIAMAEKVESNEARIIELQKIIDAKRDTANKTEHKQSLNADIATTTARLVRLVSGASPQEAIAPDETAIQYATLGSAGLGSLALLLLAPIGFFLAGRRRIPEGEDMPPSAPVTVAAPVRAMAPAPTQHHETVEVVVQQEPQAHQPKTTTELDFHPVNAVVRKKTTAFAQRCAAIADHHVQRIAMVRSAA